MNSRALRAVLPALAAALLALIPLYGSTDPGAVSDLDPFPHQEALEERVDFWRHVFGVWSRKQAVLHDLQNPGLIYEVMDLEGIGEGNYNPQQDAYIRSHRQDLEQRLHALEHKVARGDDLDNQDQELLAKFQKVGGVSHLPGAHERVRVQRGVREKFLKGLEISGRYDAAFRQVFRSYGLPEDLAYLPHVESSFQAQARSSAGAVGIWQFTLPAAKTFMTVNSAVDQRFDPILAAEGCARYLINAHKQLGDWGLAITSYNHGVGGMQKARAQYGTNFAQILRDYDGPLFGFDSHNYYVEFLAARDVARNAEQYFGTVHRESPQNWDQVALEGAAPVHQVARRYGVTVNTLLEHNTALTTQAAKGRVALPGGTEVWLPAGTLQKVAARGTESTTTVAAVVPEPVDRRERLAGQTLGQTLTASIGDSVPRSTVTDAAVSALSTSSRPNPSANQQRPAKVSDVHKAVVKTGQGARVVSPQKMDAKADAKKNTKVAAQLAAQPTKAPVVPSVAPKSVATSKATPPPKAPLAKAISPKDAPKDAKAIATQGTAKKEPAKVAKGEAPQTKGEIPVKGTTTNNKATATKPSHRS